MIDYLAEFLFDRGTIDKSQLKIFPQISEEEKSKLFDKCTRSVMVDFLVVKFSKEMARECYTEEELALYEEAIKMKDDGIVDNEILKINSKTPCIRHYLGGTIIGIEFNLLKYLKKIIMKELEKNT